MEIVTLDMCGVCLRCTVDVQEESVQSTSGRSLYGVYISSSGFQFQGAEWKLYYGFIPPSTYALYVVKVCSKQPTPFDVFVQWECFATGRTAKNLSQITNFENEFQNGRGYLIWEKQENEILNSVPEFRQYRLLKLFVIFKLKDTDFMVSQIEGSVAEQSNSTRSVSVQTTLLPNTTSDFNSLSEDLAQLMVDGSHHDVEFQCAGQSIKAHKLIACKRSPVIASMLASDMVEGRTGVVTIPNMEPDVFKHFLRYVYSGQLPELTVELALSLYESGDQYEVLALAKRCSEYLVEHLSVDNACRILLVADAHSSKDFRETVIGYMLDNEIPLSGGDWQDFCDANPKLANEVLNRFCLKMKQR